MSVETRRTSSSFIRHRQHTAAVRPVQCRRRIEPMPIEAANYYYYCLLWSECIEQALSQQDKRHHFCSGAAAAPTAQGRLFGNKTPIVGCEVKFQLKDAQSMGIYENAIRRLPGKPGFAKLRVSAVERRTCGCRNDVKTEFQF